MRRRWKGRNARRQLAGLFWKAVSKSQVQMREKREEFAKHKKRLAGIQPEAEGYLEEKDDERERKATMI